MSIASSQNRRGLSGSVRLKVVKLICRWRSVGLSEISGPKGRHSQALNKSRACAAASALIAFDVLDPRPQGRGYLILALRACPRQTKVRQTFNHAAPRCEV